MNKMGELVRKRRKEIQMTQGELAAKMGVTQSTVSQIEKGLITPTIQLLHKLAKSLSTTPSYFFKIEEPNQECLEVEKGLFEIQKAYHSYQYSHMKEWIENVRKMPCSEELKIQIRLAIWEAKWSYQTYRLDEGINICLDTLYQHQPYLTDYQIGEIHRILGDIYIGKTYMEEPHVLLEKYTQNERVSIYLKEALFHYQQAETLLKYEYYASEEYKKVLYGLGTVLLRLGEEQKASEIYARCLQFYDKDIMLANSYKGYMEHMKGSVAKEKGDFEEAFQYLQQAQSLYEKNQEWRNIIACMQEKADILRKTGQLDQAIELYRDIQFKLNRYPEQSRKDLEPSIQQAINELTEMVLSNNEKLNK